MLTSIHGQFRVLGHDDLDAQTDAVMEALLSIEETSDGTISDSDVTAALTDRIVDVSVLVRADSLDEAQAIGARAIETAIRQAGGNPIPASAEPTKPDNDFVLEKQSAELVGGVRL